jgi:hypothetical protein
MHRECCIVAVRLVRCKCPGLFCRFALPSDVSDRRAAPPLRAGAASQGGPGWLQTPEEEARC